MSKYEVVLWEQRRIAIIVESENEEMAIRDAECVWNISTEIDFENDENVQVDNHEIKSTIVTEIAPPEPEPQTLEDRYRDAAHAKQRDGELEIDGDAVVSMGEDPGAYVAAWVWVSNEEAGIEEEAT